jgi:hypothetical protein
MIAGISTLTVDPLGAWYLTCDARSSRLGQIKRRVTRMATLDLAAVVVDQGYTDADRTVILTLKNPAAGTAAGLKWIVQAHASVLLFLADGAFRATPEQVEEQGDTLTMTLLLTGAGVVSAAT